MNQIDIVLLLGLGMLLLSISANLPNWLAVLATLTFTLVGLTALFNPPGPSRLLNRSGRSCRVLISSSLLIGGLWLTHHSQPNSTPFAASGRSFTEPVVLRPVNGVLEVRLHARQGAAQLNTVARPVQDFLLFGYELIRGESSDGRKSAKNLYPGPTLNVAPGQTLIIHLANELEDISIGDYYDPAFTPAGSKVPLYPPQLINSPFNLHTHGLHVSPQGNSDNVLLDLPAGKTNIYKYLIPEDHPQGLYWYHSHRHMLTSPQTYAGLSGLLVIGRADGNLPAATDSELPIRTMAIQYNYVFDRKGGQAKLNNPNWPQYVSTLDPPKQNQLAKGTYVPKLTPVNFEKSTKGTIYATNWWSGPLSINNNRGLFQTIPSNLLSFVSGNQSRIIAANPLLPDDQRDVQFTINGKFKPIITSRPGQTEIWALANISDFAYVNLQLTETATGDHPSFLILGQDGVPYEKVQQPKTGNGSTLLLPPATRYAIAVTMPEQGGLVLEMPPMPGLAKPISGQGVLYTNDGSDSPQAELGTLSLDPKSISYIDGFFAFPTQTLATLEPEKGTGTTIRFKPGEPLNAPTSFEDTTTIEPAVKRKLLISGGFTNNNASDEDPKAFVYEFDNNIFPYTPLIQPRLNSVEEWTFENRNNDQHPIHIHVNDYQVIRQSDPVLGIDLGPQPWGQDNVNVPAPLMDEQGNVITPGLVSLRTKFEQFTGTYVVHCHRLNHEDNGLMALVNVIPEVSTYAVATPGNPETPARVQVRNGADDSLIATIVPFLGTTSLPEVAMADLDGDGVLDLLAGEGRGGDGTVVAFSGARRGDLLPFRSELVRFRAVEGQEARAGLHLAADNIDGNSHGAANIVIGTGPGTEARVQVFSSVLPKGGMSPEIFSSFRPYPGLKTGVEVATGMVEPASGRNSIVTAPGQGTPANVVVWRYDLFAPNGNDTIKVEAVDSTGAKPTRVTEVQAFDPAYTDGVSLSVGWVAGSLGGMERIIVGQRGAPGEVAVFSSGSAMNGEPELYTQPLSHTGHSTHSGDQTVLEKSASLWPMGPSSQGVRVSVSSNPIGADLLVAGLEDGVAKLRHLELTLNSGMRPSELSAVSKGQPLLVGGQAVPTIGGR